MSVEEDPSSKSGSSAEHLRDVCLEHLTLIHKMSETIQAKDRQIKILRESNNQLLQRLSSLESLEPLGKSPMLAPEEIAEESASVAASAVVFDNDENSRKRRRGRPVTKDKSVGTAPIQPSVNKSVQAKTDSVKVNGQLESDGEEEDSQDDYFYTSEPYYTFQGEEFVQEEKEHVKEIMSHAEVPGWRMITFSPSYSMEGTENIEDETMLRRHHKFELDEKKRKRWDIQRMREQRHIEKLRARYEEVTGGINGLNGTSINSTMPAVLNNLSNFQNMRPDRSLLPLPEQATHILVTEDLPVTVFGYPMPILPEQEFSLPWEN